MSDIIQSFSKVWCSSEKRIKSIWKFVVFDDRGSLKVSLGRLEFKGKKSNIEISNIRDVLITRQRVAWGSYFILDVLAILYIYYFLSAMIVGGFLVLLISNVFSVLVSLNTKWILVEYLDQNNNMKRIYFADGFIFGWSGIFGGTKKIYNILKQ